MQPLLTTLPVYLNVLQQLYCLIKMCIWFASYVQLALSDEYVNEHRKILKFKEPLKTPVEQDEVNFFHLINFRFKLSSAV